MNGSCRCVTARYPRNRRSSTGWRHYHGGNEFLDLQIATETLIDFSVVALFPLKAPLSTHWSVWPNRRFISRQRFGVTSLSARLKNDSLFLSEDYTEGVSLSLGSSDTQVCHAGDEFADSGGARAAGRFSSNGDPKNSPGAKPFSHGRFHTRDAGARIGSLGETLQSMGRSAPQDLIVTVHG